jgi:hypothetical protein
VLVSRCSQTFEALGSGFALRTMEDRQGCTEPAATLTLPFSKPKRQAGLEGFFVGIRPSLPRRGLVSALRACEVIVMPEV